MRRVSAEQVRIELTHHLGVRIPPRRELDARYAVKILQMGRAPLDITGTWKTILDAAAGVFGIQSSMVLLLDKDGAEIQYPLELNTEEGRSSLIIPYRLPRGSLATRESNVNLLIDIGHGLERRIVVKIGDDPEQIRDRICHEGEICAMRRIHPGRVQGMVNSLLSEARGDLVSNESSNKEYKIRLYDMESLIGRPPKGHIGDLI